MIEVAVVEQSIVFEVQTVSFLIILLGLGIIVLDHVSHGSAGVVQRPSLDIDRL